jgi:hypothetical protein
MKGQSAVEYITTYGWAIFALIIVVGIIMASGMFTPNFFISESCNLGSNFNCRSAVYNSNAASSSLISFELLNSFAYQVQITDITITTTDGSANFALSPSTPLSIESGAKVTFQGPFSGKRLSDNEVKQFNVLVTYRSCAPELGTGCSGDIHTVSGRIIAKVIPAD